VPLRRRAPWWILAVLVVIWFVSNGFENDQLLVRVIGLAMFIVTPVAVVALIAAHVAMRSSWRAQIIERVRRASGLTLSGGEAQRFADAVESMQQAVNPFADVREPPASVTVSLHAHPGRVLRIEHRGSAPNYAAVVAD
jgi:hypothetical protein